MNTGFQRKRGSVTRRKPAAQRPFRLLQNAIDALSDHIALLNGEAVIIAVNGAWRRFGEDYGLRLPRHGLGVNYLEVCDTARGQHSEEAHFVASSIRKLLSEQGGTFSGEYSCDTPTEKRWFHLCGGYFKEGPRSYVLLAHHPLTELKRVEEFFRPSQDRLQVYAQSLEEHVAERTARLEESLRTMEGFLYHVAHNLRAPLRAIHGFTHLLSERHAEGLDATGQDFLRRISIATEEMNDLITGLLDYGRLGLEVTSFTRINLSPLMEHCLTGLAPAVKRRNAEIQCEPNLPCVWGDARLLEQVLAQLLDNALKFTRPDAPPRIRIRAESVQSPEPEVQSPKSKVQGPESAVRGQPTEEGTGEHATRKTQHVPDITPPLHHSATPLSSVRLWIDDNGIGIAPEHQATIFNVFERLPEAGPYPGTGIGLAIAKRGVEKMGGRIGVESQPGQGSRFWLELKSPPPDTRDHLSTRPGAETE